MSEITETKEPQIIERIECQTAEELLDVLAPWKRPWSEPRAQWIYRGEADARWHLLATAHRAEHRNWGQADPARQFRLLSVFKAKLDRSGLPIPTFDPFDEFRRQAQVLGSEPYPSWVPLMALAQHHGLPTPLLDWTRSARKAAYFAAAYEPREASEEETRRLRIWALRADFFQDPRKLPVCKLAAQAWLTIEEVPRGSNPNLHAQDGLFTWLHTQAPKDLDELLRTSSEVSRGWRPDASGPLMCCLSVPAKGVAMRLLKLLAKEGIDGSTMFPSTDGVVQAVREERWQNPGLLDSPYTEHG